MEKAEFVSRRSIRRRVEKGLFVLGTVLVGVYLAALLHGVVLSKLALWRFENAHVARAATTPGAPASAGDAVDTSLWSVNRIAAYKESLVSKLDSPIGELRIPKLKLQAPVFEGTDDLTLNRGVGRIAGTAQLGDTGNSGIAGHRDGFFRSLKDIQVGDSVELLVENRSLPYIVRSIEIVKPEDTSVLRPANDAELTLVTCYPFYFVGSAPQRFIVHASLAANPVR